MHRNEVAVALLSETPEHGAHLREALRALGTSIVYETSTHALDRSALEHSHANVVVVNLDASGPAASDLDALLTDTRYRVVFDDGEVSSNLSGWDQARWARHLAAKVFGDADIDPPRPAAAWVEPAREVAPVEPPQVDTRDADGIAVAERDAPAGGASDAPVAALPLLDEFDAVIEARERRAAQDIEDLLLQPFDLADPEDPPLLAAASSPIDAAPDDGVEFESFAIDEGLLAAFEEDVSSPTGTSPDAPVAAAARWTLEDILENVDAASAARGPAAFGIETLSAEEFLAPADEDDPARPAMFAPESGLTLELIPLEEAVAPAPVEALVRESWLDPDAVTMPAKVRRVWVLGASIGGPESVREFLAELPRDYPALFLLTQHLGGEFVDLMTRQLAKATPLTVRMPTHGERVGHGEIAVVPTTHRLLVDAEGVIVLERNTEQTEYSPSIDRVLRDVADRFGAAAGAIIFSGMSSDAVEGCRYLADKGGRVYAQEPDTCVVSAMVDGVREAGVVGFVGSPRELAEQLLAESKQTELRQGI